MAASLSLALALAAALPLFLANTPHVQAETPAPSPKPFNLTGVLEEGGQFTTLMRLLVATHTYEQLVNQLNNSDQGVTLFAPTDNAFNNLKAGTLNSLSQQQQVALLLYHVLPRFYSLDMFDTVSNPLATEAAGNGGGVYGLNFSSASNQVNVSTGVVDVQINNALRSKFPLAVYQLDQVLLPLDLFGPKANKTEAPAPALTPRAKKSPVSASSSADAPSASEESAPNAGSRMSNHVGWVPLVGLLIMMVGTVW